MTGPVALAAQIDEVVRGLDLGRPSARTGRSPERPYVPVVVTTDDTGRDHEAQILGLAYATRTEAVERAAARIERLRRDLAAKLAQRPYRALRESYGLPRELSRFQSGDRVRLVRCEDPFTRLATGALGSVVFVDDLGTIHVAWDDGHKLGMVEEAGDRIELVTQNV